MTDKRFLSVVFVATILCGFCACAYRLSRIEIEFKLVTVAEAGSSVIQKIGPPDVVETAAEPFLKYASQPCRLPCAKRLWWEHPVLKGIEAWSVALDTSGAVLDKVHWVSP